MMIALIDLIGAALSIWSSKEKTKYTDKYKELCDAYYLEYNKSLDERSDAVLGNLDRELRNLAKSLARAIHGTGVPPA